MNFFNGKQAIKLKHRTPKILPVFSVFIQQLHLLKVKLFEFLFAWLSDGYSLPNAIPPYQCLYQYKKYEVLKTKMSLKFLGARCSTGPIRQDQRLRLPLQQQQQQQQRASGNQEGRKAPEAFLRHTLKVKTQSLFLFCVYFYLCWPPASLAWHTMNGWSTYSLHSTFT